MPRSIFDDLALRAASLGLNGLAQRQRVTAHNVANVDTPGFKAQRVDFEAQLQRELKQETEIGLPLSTTAPAHLHFQSRPGAELSTVSSLDTDLRNDENNVDIDLEMTTLAETAIRYQALTQLASKKLAMLRSIVRDGR
ncbi:MAG TPA: flagellar basal body rod protein FlgB [Anaerolineae bacterium]|nr:flagellar basal body rod protein FlgB [Anaerolineae bacterium]HMR64311.1 flagellar basal body rod protein FlgB [Anaerolineae bacterium]